MNENETCCAKKQQIEMMEQSFIYYLLDESGSMSSKTREITNGMNEFLETQRMRPGCFISLFSFSDQWKALFEDKEAGEVSSRELSDYHPNGVTALYDALGYVLTQKIDCERPGKHVLIVLTDGEENASRDFSLSRIREIILSKKRQGLEVVFIGSNQDAVLNGASLGLEGRNCLNYTDDRLEEAMRCVTQNIYRYQSGEEDTCGFTDIQRVVSDSTQAAL